ncbi:MAG: Mth938-like domain-containing protein [Hyphomicrobiaceae bacterium]
MAETPQGSSGRYPALAPIDAYGNGGFRFAGMSHRGSIICLPNAIEAWTAVTMAEVTPDSLRTILTFGGVLDLVMLGTGAEHIWPSEEVREAFREAGIGLDIMSTGAAARTWNILIAEGRPVAAAMLAVD